ncbi:MAG: DUF2249 domain-containing protein [Chloroflexota bacterium]|nr:MAG: DUF2249 domain-containing protein [Chloroflexota bacterium]
MSVTPNMKISELLKQYPQLLDVLVAQSPEFKRLKNPLVRKVQSRLATVAQAAAMARLDPAALVRTLNLAIGEPVPETPSVQLASAAGAPPPPWLTTAPVAVELDVREDQRRGGQVLTSIMAAVGQVKTGQIFRLRNTFEPLPLYDALAKQGFVPWARELGPEDWEVFFFKSADGTAPAVPRVQVEEGASAPSEEVPTDTLTVDVRELVPPQPMLRIMDALERLQSGQTLLVHHVRRPVYLFPRLDEMGYRYQVRDIGPEQVDLLITKPR